MKSKYRTSISDNSLALRLKYITNIKYTHDLKYLYQKKVKYSINSFCIDYMWNDNILDILGKIKCIIKINFIFPHNQQKKKANKI